MEEINRFNVGDIVKDKHGKHGTVIYASKRNKIRIRFSVSESEIQYQTNCTEEQAGVFLVMEHDIVLKYVQYSDESNFKPWG